MMTLLIILQVFSGILVLYRVPIEEYLFGMNMTHIVKSHNWGQIWPTKGK